MPNVSSAILSPCNLLVVLETELARAQRYNYFLSLLLFRMTYTASSRHRLSPAEIAEVLANNVRQSDHVGIVDERTAAVILPYTDVEIARGVLERLRLEVLLFLSSFSNEYSIRGACAAYPTEATSRQALMALAGQRLW